MQSQIEYMEKLVEGYQARLKAGDKTVELKLRHATVKLEELKIKREFEEQAKKKTAPSTSLTRFQKPCCGRR